MQGSGFKSLATIESGNKHNRMRVGCVQKQQRKRENKSVEVQAPAGEIL